MNDTTPIISLVLTAAEVGDLLGYKAETVRRLVRSSHLPGPIDDTINPKLWRWSRRTIEAYIAQGDVAS